jgi:iron complex transport system permease protein
MTGTGAAAPSSSDVAVAATLPGPAKDAADPDPRAVLGAVRSTTRRQLLGLLVLIGALAVAVVLSLALGARDIAPGVVVETLFGQRPAGDYDAAVIIGERLPRTLLGVVVGMSLAAAGVLMQGLTRNPLVDGGVLGVELGAACAVVVAIVLLGVTDPAGYFWFALVGAGMTTAVVIVLSWLSTRVSAAIGLVLVGAATAAALGAAINLLVIRDESAFARYRFWSIGQLTGRGDTLAELWPFAAAGLLLALCCGGLLNALTLGEQAAAGLGVRVRRSQIGVALVAVLLCAAATAAAGPIAFVGLVGAHLARLIVGADQRRLIPYGMLCGALLLITADVLGRLGPGQGEIPVGIMTALVGTPFFVVLARRRRLVEA